MIFKQVFKKLHVQKRALVIQCSFCSNTQKQPCNYESIQKTREVWVRLLPCKGIYACTLEYIELSMHRSSHGNPYKSYWHTLFPSGSPDSCFHNIPKSQNELQHVVKLLFWQTKQHKKKKIPARTNSWEIKTCLADQEWRGRCDSRGAPEYAKIVLWHLAIITANHTVGALFLAGSEAMNTQVYWCVYIN